MQGLSKTAPNGFVLPATRDTLSRFSSLLLALLLRFGCITKTEKLEKPDSPRRARLSAIFSMTSTHTNLDWDSSTLHPCFADPLLDRTNFQDSDVSSTPGQNLEDPYATASPAYQIADTDAAIEEMT